MAKRQFVTSKARLVRVYAPSASTPYFRIEYRDAFNERQQTTGGRDATKAMVIAEDIERRLLAVREDAQTATHVRHLTAGFKDPARDKFKSVPTRSTWSHGYTAHINRCVTRIDEVAGDVLLRSFSPRHVTALLQGCATEAAARDLQNVLRAMVNFGVEGGYLRPDQAHIWNVDVPSGMPSTLAKSVATPFAPAASVPASKVPTVSKVCALAEADVRYPLWVGMVHTAAGAGLRIHELLALRATDVIPFEDGVVLLVERQLVELDGGGIAFSPPKNGYARLVSVAGRYSGTFDLAEWLLNRAAEALDEQQAGRNADAIMFPTRRSRTHWRLRNLRRDLFNPAAEAAGWNFRIVFLHTTDRDGKAKQIRQRRWTHTIHALRHRYATTAIDEWGFDVAELTQSGGWASDKFVFDHYYGGTDDTLASAQRKQIRRSDTSQPEK